MRSPESSASSLLQEAISQHHQGNLEDACLLYLEALDTAADSPLLHFNLGLALYELEHYEEACEYYLNALEYAPEEPDVLYNLALCLKKREKYDESISLFRRILEVNPRDVDTLYNLACCYTDTIDDARATQYYRKVLELDEEHLSALNNLAYVYHRNEDFTNAAALYRRLLELDPDNRSARHMLDSLRGNTPDKAPPQYVKEVFDDYSEYFEENLLSQLHYTVPWKLRELFDATHDRDEEGFRGLDLGCGTGLCGEVFADLCSYLHGVDIAPKMLEISESKRCYSKLTTAEILSFLRSCEERYDLVLAGDVLNYLGDLTELAQALAAITPTGGKFCFSIERKSGSEEDFQVQKTGRFAHSPSYIARVFSESGWRIEAEAVADLRKDGSEWISGGLYLASRIAEVG